MEESKNALLEDVDKLIAQPDIPQREPLKPSLADMHGTVTSYTKDEMRQTQLNNEVADQRSIKDAETIAGKGSQKSTEIEGIFKPGYFEMRPAPNKRLIVTIEPNIRGGVDGKRRLWKQKTAIFAKGIIYHFTNRYHCANLRCNPSIMEVFPGNKS